MTKAQMLKYLESYADETEIMISQYGMQDINCIPIDHAQYRIIRSHGKRDHEGVIVLLWKDDGNRYRTRG